MIDFDAWEEYEIKNGQPWTVFKMFAGPIGHQEHFQYGFPSPSVTLEDRVHVVGVFLEKLKEVTWSSALQIPHSRLFGR